MLFWDTARIGLHALMLKNHIRFLRLSRSTAFLRLFQLLSLWALPLLLWLVSSHTPNAASPTTTEHMVWCHKFTKLEVRLPTRRFRSSAFCGRRELLSVMTLTFLTFQTFNTHKNRQKKTLNTVWGYSWHQFNLSWDLLIIDLWLQMSFLCNM